MTDRDTKEARQLPFPASETFMGEKILMTYVRSGPAQQEIDGEGWGQSLGVS